jgi:hypothetical protein
MGFHVRHKSVMPLDMTTFIGDTSHQSSFNNS